MTPVNAPRRQQLKPRNNREGEKMNKLEGRWWLVPPPPLLHLSCQSEKPVSKASCIHGYRHCDAASGTVSQAMKSALPLHAVQTPRLCTCPQDSTHLDQETIPTPVAHHTPTIRARRTLQAPHLGQERNEPAHVAIPTAILVPLLMPACAGHQVAHAARSAAARFSRRRAAPPPLSPAGGRLEGEERFVRGSREGDRRWEFLAVRAPFVVSGGLLVVGVATFHLEIMLGGASVTQCPHMGFTASASVLGCRENDATRAASLSHQVSLLLQITTRLGHGTAALVWFRYEAFAATWRGAAWQASVGMPRRTSVFAAASATQTHCTDPTQMEACRRTSTPNNVQELVCLFLPVHRYLAGPYTECVLVVHACTVNKRRRLAGMSMPWAMAVSVVDKVWALLAVWVSTCLSAATAVARAARTGEIGPLHIA
nr:unnamed protein product [Digitaria exilis]